MSSRHPPPSADRAGLHGCAPSPWRGRRLTLGAGRRRARPGRGRRHPDRLARGRGRRDHRRPGAQLRRPRQLLRHRLLHVPRDRHAVDDDRSPRRRQGPTRSGSATPPARSARTRTSPARWACSPTAARARPCSLPMTQLGELGGLGVRPRRRDPQRRAPTPSPLQCDRGVGDAAASTSTRSRSAAPRPTPARATAAPRRATRASSTAPSRPSTSGARPGGGGFGRPDRLHDPRLPRPGRDVEHRRSSPAPTRSASTGAAVTPTTASSVYVASSEHAAAPTPTGGYQVRDRRQRHRRPSSPTGGTAQPPTRTRVVAARSARSASGTASRSRSPRRRIRVLLNGTLVNTVDRTARR